MTNDREPIKYQFVYPHYQRVHNTITNYANNITQHNRYRYINVNPIRYSNLRDKNNSRYVNFF